MNYEIRSTLCIPPLVLVVVPAAQRELPPLQGASAVNTCLLKIEGVMIHTPHTHTLSHCELHAPHYHKKKLSSVRLVISWFALVLL